MKKIVTLTIALTTAVSTMFIGQSAAVVKQANTPFVSHAGEQLERQSKPKPQPCGGIKKIHLVTYQQQRDSSKPSSIRNPTKCRVTVRISLQVSIYLLDKDYGRLNICTPSNNGLCWGKWYSGTQDNRVSIGPHKTVPVSLNYDELVSIVREHELRMGNRWTWQSSLDGFSTSVVKVTN